MQSFYLDDGTLGGSMEEVIADFHTVKNLDSEVVLDLNFSKCEVIIHDFCSIGETFCAIPGSYVVNPKVATLLRCPIGGVENYQ